MDCIFCKIANNKIPSYTIYEDDFVKAFLDINPDSDGHTLIIPKKHYTDIDDIDSNTLSHVMEIAKKLKKEYEIKLGCDGIILQQNNGFIQEVKHYHLHLKPMYSSKLNIKLEKNEKHIKNVEDIYNLLK